MIIVHQPAEEVEARQSLRRARAAEARKQANVASGEAKVVRKRASR